MIAGNHSSPDDAEDVGEFVEVEEKVMEVHLGMRSDLRELSSLFFFFSTRLSHSIILS